MVVVYLAPKRSLGGGALAACKEILITLICSPPGAGKGSSLFWLGFVLLGIIIYKKALEPTLTGL
jgi:hypothetical protein